MCIKLNKSPEYLCRSEVGSIHQLLQVDAKLHAAILNVLVIVEGEVRFWRQNRHLRVLHTHLLVKVREFIVSFLQSPALLA
jgi:hypothetical protein